MRRFLEYLDGVVLSAVFRTGIRIYQVSLGLLFRGSCRFHPSCSHYAEEAILKYGAMKGAWLTLARLARCHPFHRGGFDPVP